jgi:hypothetical protein
MKQGCVCCTLTLVPTTNLLIALFGRVLRPGDSSTELVTAGSSADDGAVGTTPSMNEACSCKVEG